MNSAPVYQDRSSGLLHGMTITEAAAHTESETVEVGVGLPEAIAEILGCNPDDLRPHR